VTQYVANGGQKAMVALKGLTWLKHLNPSLSKVVQRKLPPKMNPNDPKSSPEKNTYSDILWNLTTDSTQKTIFHLTHGEIGHNRHAPNGRSHQTAAPQRQKLSARHPGITFSTHALCDREMAA
jgi:hypothetical protein